LEGKNGKVPKKGKEDDCKDHRKWYTKKGEINEKIREAESLNGFGYNDIINLGGQVSRKSFERRTLKKQTTDRERKVRIKKLIT